MEEQGTDEATIQAQIDELTRLSRLLDSIYVFDANTWEQQKQAGERYLEVSDWLRAHGVQVYWNKDQKCFIRREIVK